MLKLNFVFDANGHVAEHDIYLNKDNGLFYIEHTNEILSMIRNKLGRRESLEYVYHDGHNYIEVMNRLGDWFLVC